ncbi:MAG TPA: CPBP family intramembrane glutamic endopeptidase [Anaeromyxobacter sp.]|nr:CPBP family intramembrane glutamic endopeptidase [Anaeromyxobacter sp.]
MEPPPPEQPLETVLVAPAPPPLAAAPPRVWTTFLALAAYLVGSLVAGSIVVALAYVGATRPHGAPPDPEQVGAALVSPLGLLASVLVQLALAVGIALAAAGLSRERLTARLALGRAALGAGALALASLGLLLCGGVMQELVEVLGIPITGPLEQLERVLRALSPGELAVALLVGGVLVPMGEELFFRGYVQSRLCRRWGTWPGIACTAIFFALAHFDLLHSASALVAGFYLGWLAQRTGSTVPGMIVHAVNNLVAIATGWALRDPELSRGAHAALLAALLAGAVAVIAWLARRLPRAAPAAAPARAPADENAASLGG